MLNDGEIGSETANLRPDVLRSNAPPAPATANLRFLRAPASDLKVRLARQPLTKEDIMSRSHHIAKITSGAAAVLLSSRRPRPSSRPIAAKATARSESPTDAVPIFPCRREASSRSGASCTPTAPCPRLPSAPGKTRPEKANLRNSGSVPRAVTMNMHPAAQVRLLRRTTNPSNHREKP